ncbi:MAG TPA: Maf family protein [Tepidisphaeraceae bacterium]|nr:Maf family protein [Tepidisphaeraceae bacterium]
MESTVESSSTPSLVLASESPRRKQLLTEAGYIFTVEPANIDETVPADMLPSDVALHLAQAKAKVVSQKYPDAIILAADTVVAFGDQVLGKPADPADARNMLGLLAGTTHIVITGVCVVHQKVDFTKCRRMMSAVRMRQMSRLEIDRYVESNQWRGKAGGYGIQDSDPFVTRVAGSHTNIVGLPMTLVRDLLAEAGILPPHRAGMG